MSQQVICDSCGEPIDQSISYWSMTVLNSQMIDGALQQGGDPIRRYYHSDHLPAMDAG